MLDWERMHPVSQPNYTRCPPFNPNITNQYFPFGFGDCQPSINKQDASGQNYFYPPPPTKPSCYEAKCTTCPFKQDCKNAK
jgi:hypothetical protein